MTYRYSQGSVPTVIFLIGVTLLLFVYFINISSKQAKASRQISEELIKSNNEFFAAGQQVSSQQVALPSRKVKGAGRQTYRNDYFALSYPAGATAKEITVAGKVVGVNIASDPLFLGDTSWVIPQNHWSVFVKARFLSWFDPNEPAEPLRLLFPHAKGYQRLTKHNQQMMRVQQEYNNVSWPAFLILPAKVDLPYVTLEVRPETTAALSVTDEIIQSLTVKGN